MCKLQTNEFYFNSSVSEYELVAQLDYSLSSNIDKCSYNLRLYLNDSAATEVDVASLPQVERFSLAMHADEHFNNVLPELYSECMEYTPSYYKAPYLYKQG